MFENTNKALPIEIAKETMRVHRLRNIMACLAIILTCVLITVVCGVGIGTVDANIAESGVKPGPGTNGMGIYGDMQTLDKIRMQTGVEWADIARPCTQGSPENKEFVGNTVKFLAVNQEYYGHHYVDLISGEYPQNEHEILMSDTLAKKVGREMKPGQKIKLNLVILKGGKRVLVSHEFIICGFYDNPLERIDNYEEIYTLETAPDKINPALNDISSVIYVKLKNSSSPTDVSEKMEDLNKTVGGRGIVLNIEIDISEEVINTTVLLLLVVICGFLLIYNIFYISVVNDIRFMGNMKIIGMTKRQIHTMLGWQIRRLGAVGIIIGSLLGTGMNVFVIQLFRSTEYSYARYYDMERTLLFGIAAGIIFTVFTVWISSRTAVSLAGRVSLVAASKFCISGKKKKVFAVVSYALGGMLFCVIFTVFAGYDTDWAVDRMNNTDYTIKQWHSIQCMSEPYEPMEEEFVEEIRSLDFVEQSYLYYRARGGSCDVPDEYNIYGENYAEIRYDGLYKQVVEREIGKMDGHRTAEEMFVKNGRAETGILGMEPAALSVEKETVDILDGRLDADLFATGEYLIYAPYIPGYIAKKDYLEYGMRAGNKITISFWDPEMQEYHKRTFTILAVVVQKDDCYAGEIGAGIQLVIPNKVFTGIYGEAAKRMLCALHFNTSGRNPKMEQNTIKRKTMDYFNPQIHVNSRYQSYQKEYAQKREKVLIGAVLGAIFAWIGLVNILNTLVTNVLSKKLEYATMQSIGMTKRQMASGICLDGLKMVIIGFVPVSVIGLIMAWQFASLMETQFVLVVYVQSCIATLFAGVAVVCAASFALTANLNKKTIVERLREME